MAKRRLQMVVSFLLVSGLTACGGGGASVLQASGALQASTLGFQNHASRTRAAFAQTPGSYVAIDAGGPVAGGNWSADADYSGGSSAVVSAAIDVSHVSSPAPQSVYQSQRWGRTLSYAIPNLTPNGSYTVRLHFVESFFNSPAQRTFDAKVNGVTVLSSFDIFTAAGGKNVALVRDVSSTANNNGKITVVLGAIRNNASIAGIEVIGGNAPTPVPSATPLGNGPTLAINVGGGAVANWTADEDYNGGWVSPAVSHAIDTTRVINAAPQSVYQTQRCAAAATYVIANLTANAAYTVRLHFAETFFNAAGQRIFNVKINNTQALSNFDIFQAAGGQFVAVVKEFVNTADTSGKINIQFNSKVNNASLAGIEIVGGSNTPPSPTPTPSSTPGNGSYPIYSSSFTGNTPFHHTVAELMASGATVLSSTIARNYWAQGVGNSQPASQSGGPGPLYVAAAGQPAYTFSCPAYGKCNADGLLVHYPAGAYPQTGIDHHLNSFDRVFLHGELDGWGGDGNSKQACNLTAGNPGTATCSWGGFYPFNGDGLATNGDSATAGGYALGLMNITAEELLQGHIDHALGIQQSCEDNGGVYPARPGRGTDAACPSNLEPNAVYGNMIHLKSSVDVAALGYSPYCKVIAQALQTYGAYTDDNNGSYGLALNLEFMNAYSGANPWFNTIFPSMVAGGDGSGSGQNFSFGTCLNRIPASAIEVIRISSTLPRG